MRTVRRKILVGSVFLAMLIGVCPGQEMDTEKPIPISITASYTLVSDYVYRGINLSEYAGEGHEMVNHQVELGVSLDLDDVGLGDIGTVSASIWAEIYAGQKSMPAPPGGGAAPGQSHVQEVDVTLSWAYDIPDTDLGVEFGWIAYTYPAAGGGDPNKTYEVYGKVSYSGDGELLGQGKESILNPYVAYYYDYDEVDGGWLQLGISHEFDLAEVTEALKNFTATPSLVVGFDNSYLDEKTRLGNMEYGLDVAYDVSAALDLPTECGSIDLTAFVRFSNAMGDNRLSDEFFGGLTVGYSW